MFFDIMFEVGGQNLVETASDIFLPVYEYVCNLATTSWIWECIAAGMEAMFT